MHHKAQFSTSSSLTGLFISGRFPYSPMREHGRDYEAFKRIRPITISRKQPTK